MGSDKMVDIYRELCMEMLRCYIYRERVMYGDVIMLHIWRSTYGDRYMLYIVSYVQRHVNVKIS